MGDPQALWPEMWGLFSLVVDEFMTGMRSLPGQGAELIP